MSVPQASRIKQLTARTVTGEESRCQTPFGEGQADQRRQCELAGLPAGGQESLTRLESGSQRLWANLEFDNV
jgi:hypothetical protein